MITKQADEYALQGEANLKLSHLSFSQYLKYKCL